MAYRDGRSELYNLCDDPGETEDLAPADPEEAKEIRGRLTAWERSVGVLPVPEALAVAPLLLLSLTRRGTISLRQDAPGASTPW